jgi:molybdate transport system substrate-binding protein
VRRLALALAALALAGAARAEGGRRTVRVAAAANLRPVLADLAAAFEREEPRAHVRVTVGASGALFAQIRNGAPVDVFFSADRDLPRRLVEVGLGGPEVAYALGRLVAWAPKGSPVALGLARTGLRALASPGVRKIAIANPAVAPYGRAATAALDAAGVLAAVEGRLVLGESVAQAAQFAATGAADAALLPASLARQPPLAGGAAFPVPPELHPPLEQSAVVLARAREPALARAFLDFVTGRKGREILRRHAYDLP